MRIAPGSMLVATVDLVDSFFGGTVIVILDAGEHGVLGSVVNRLSDYDLEAVLPGWSATASAPAHLFNGGPVSSDGAICLAIPSIPEEEPPGWRRVFADVGLLQLDTPLEIVAGAYRELRIFAGYAGWAPAQLERELAEGSWYLVDAEPSDLFDPDPASLWRRVLKRQGGERALLATWTNSPELN